MLTAAVPYSYTRLSTWPYKPGGHTVASLCGTTLPASYPWIQFVCTSWNSVMRFKALCLLHIKYGHVSKSKIEQGWLRKAHVWPLTPRSLMFFGVCLPLFAD